VPKLPVTGHLREESPAVNAAHGPTGGKSGKHSVFVVPQLSKLGGGDGFLG
jgi:hypothetical protein